jgi:hypothetical protein
MAHSLKTDEENFILPSPPQKMTTQNDEENTVVLDNIVSP